MAILTRDESQIEVKIKKHSDETYFEEYVKVGDREKPDATSCERYIVPEPGVTFTIEVTLKKGFVFGKYTVVRAYLYVPGFKQWVARAKTSRPKNHQRGTKEDITLEINPIEVLFSGQRFEGARLGFKELSIGTVDMFNLIFSIY